MTFWVNIFLNYYRTMPKCCTIALRISSFRLVCQLQDDVLVLLNFAVGKCDKSVVRDTS